MVYKLNTFDNHVEARRRRGLVWIFFTLEKIKKKTLLFEQVLDQRDIPEVSEKIFTHDISMIRRQKMVIFGVLKVFISNFT